VSRAFIRNGKTPTSGTSSFSLRIATEGDRTRTRDYDYTRPLAQSGLQCNLHIAHNLDFSRNHFCSHITNDAGNLCPSCSGGADAGIPQLPRIDSRGGARPPYRLVQRFASANFSNPSDVAGA
jgi:hypothetical protein